MYLIDNKSDFSYDVCLTAYGKSKLARGEGLGLSKYAIFDTGIDYTLYNTHSLDSLLRLPMLESNMSDNLSYQTYLYTQYDTNKLGNFKVKISSIPTESVDFFDDIVPIPTPTPTTGSINSLTINTSSIYLGDSININWTYTNLTGSLIVELI